MYRPLASALLLNLSFIVVGCSSASEDDSAAGAGAIASQEATDIRASERPEHQALVGVQAIRSIASQDAVSLRLYETGGGDPALNGDMPWLAIEGGPDDSAIFDLGLNVSTITKAEAPAKGTVKLTGTQDTLDADGNPKSEPFEAIITYSANDGTVAPTIKVTSGASSYDVQKSTKADERFVSSFFAMSSAVSGGALARVYSATGGDPAMNGVSVFLVLENFPEYATYDLGLNVAGVTKVTMVRDGQLRIEGKQDTMDGEGTIRHDAFAYEVSFDVDASTGKPSPTIKMTKR